MRQGSRDQASDSACPVLPVGFAAALGCLVLRCSQNHPVRIQRGLGTGITTKCSLHLGGVIYTLHATVPSQLLEQVILVASNVIACLLIGIRDPGVLTHPEGVICSPQSLTRVSFGDTG